MHIKNILEFLCHSNEKLIYYGKHTSHNRMLPYEKVKLVFVGDSGVGKTSLIQTLLQRPKSIPLPTVKADMYVHTQTIQTNAVKFQLWDTTDNSLHHLKGADGCILIHDSTNSLEQYLTKWDPIIREHTLSPIFLCHSHSESIIPNNIYNETYIIMAYPYNHTSLEPIYIDIYKYIKDSRGY